jgi:hypothetical protein
VRNDIGMSEQRRDHGDDDSTFSGELESLLDDEDLTLGELTNTLGERSFAVVLILLMLPAALPLPTGGVTHVLELAAVLVAAQMIANRRAIWLPQRLARRRLGATFTAKAIPAALKPIRRFERISRPRLARLVDTRGASAVLGVVLLVLVVAAFVAPPFTGLDTLPALGAVLVCVGVIFSDGVVVGGGLVVGTAGITLEIVLGRLAWSLL